MTQNESILQYLQQGNSLTSLEALDKFRCFRLASRINDLHNLGHQIESVMERHGDKHYKRYFIKKDVEEYPTIPSHAEELQEEIGCERWDRKVKNLTLF